MNTTAQENLLDWLRDAHAMEEQAETMLSTTADRLENYPELKTRLQQHVEETRGQAALVRNCIERLGGDISMVKDVSGKVMAMAQGMSGMLVTDEVVKASLATYAFKHMEIASYRVLIAAAEVCADVAIKQVCEQILAQEEAMAAWLAQRLPETVREFLARDQAPNISAKR